MRNPSARETSTSSSRHRLIGPAAALTGLVLALPLVASAPAFANDSDVVRSGSCSSGTHWKLKAKPDDGRIEVEAEIDSNRVGQTWHWKIRHNGSVSAKGKSRTKPPSGSFEIHRRMADLWHDDTFKLQATNRKSGEVCRGTVRL
jgi:hypothetical protein